MKNFKVILLSIITALSLNAQSYMVDIGTLANTEKLHDAILMGSGSSSRSVLAGVTNSDGFDRVMIASIDASSGSLFYEKKYNFALGLAKERIVITTVKIAHDNNSVSMTCMMAGSYTRTTVTGSPLSYGFFSLIFDGGTGNIINLKRWDSSVSGVTGTSVAAVCAGPDNNFYVTGNISYATPQPFMFVMALNSANNLLWNKIDLDTPTLTGGFIVADIVYSPYSPSGANEVVVTGYCNPYQHGNPSSVFIRRFNTASGALIAQNLFSSANNDSHIISAITPSLSSAGTYDGFLLCGTLEDNTATKYGWVIKTNTTGNAITWSKSYKYNVAGTQLAGSDIIEAEYVGLDPYSFYLTGTAINGTTSASDAYALKLDANGAALWLMTFTPSLSTTNKNEQGLFVTQHSTTTHGFNIYGNRTNPLNPAQTDMYSLRAADYNMPTGVYNCEDLESTPFIVADISLSVSAFTTQDYAVLNAQTMTQTITNLSLNTPICYHAMVGGFRIQKPDDTASKLLSAEIYPNPNSGSFILRRNNDESADIEIYDLSGRVIFNCKNMTGETLLFDISDQPHGTYLVRITSATEVKTMRLIKD